MRTANGWFNAMSLASIQLSSLPYRDHCIRACVRVRQRRSGIPAYAMRCKNGQSRDSRPAIWNIPDGYFSQVGSVFSYLIPCAMTLRDFTLLFFFSQGLC